VTTSPLVAAVSSNYRTSTTGASLVDSFQGVYQSVKGGSWVDEALAGGSFAVEAAATALDPLSALLSNGLGWALEYWRVQSVGAFDLGGSVGQDSCRAHDVDVVRP
jgi:hypothetical protein